jgi:hypothetical protein
MTGPTASTARTPRQFVGRVRELEDLRDALDQAASGHGGVAVVTGDAGIGKTRLLQEFVKEATGWTVLAGRCWEEGGAPAYWPWIQVVRAAGGEFVALASPSADEAGAQRDPESVRFALFDAVSRFLLDREGPALIVIEDLHAADEPSLLLLRFLGDAIADSRILVVCSYRDGEPSVRELSRHFSALARVGRRIALRGLSPEEVQTLVTRAVGETAARTLAPRLAATTGGNPFFLSELLRSIDADGAVLRIPEGVRAVIRHRIDTLSPEAATLLQLAAVGGRTLDLAVLERMSRLTPDLLVDAIGEAVDAGVLVEDLDGSGPAFAHELVRATLYEDLSIRRRHELHLGMGTVLEELAAGDLERRLSEIAHHLAAATPLGDVEKAAAFLQRAGDRAVMLAAYEEAARHYGRALQLLGADEEGADRRRCGLLMCLGDAQWRAGDGKAARASFESAIAIARRLEDGDLLARAALGYVTALGGFLFYARFEVGASAAALLADALAALPEEDSLLRATLLSRLAVEYITGNEPIERRAPIIDEAVAMSRRLGDVRALVTAFHARHWALADPGHVLDRLGHSEEMLAAATQAADREMEFLAHNARFHCFLELGDGAALDREIEEMATIAGQMRQPFYLWHTMCLRVVRAILDGRYAEAEELASAALETGQLRQSDYPAYVHRFAQVFAIRWGQGRLGECRDEVKAHAEGFPWIHRWREALVAAEMGDETSARSEVERFAAGEFEHLPRDGLWLLHMCSLAEACVLIGDRERAERLYALLLPHAELPAVAYTLQPFGPVAMRLGMLAKLLGRWDEAEDHFAGARRRCEKLGARGILARVLYEHAGLRAARGDAAGAAVRLDEAAALADELGLSGLLERVAAVRETAPASAPAAARFAREGDVWAIAYGGDEFRVRHVKGLRYIADLLAIPGREVFAIELAQAAEGVSREAPAVGSLAPVGPALDEDAKAAYRRRLNELGEELEQAREWGDPERAAHAEDEIDALTNELTSALGLGGRDRAVASPAERARVSVTKAIRSAIRAIERHSPALAEHLTASIHTGQFCSYAPPGETPPRWSL